VTDGKSASLSRCRAQLFITVGHFRSSCRGTPSLTRGRVVQFVVTLRSKSHRTIALFETPPTWRARSPYLYPPGTGWPSYTPGHCVQFMSPLTTRRDYGGGILTRIHTGHGELACTNPHTIRDQYG
jgi:hypothetical protein